MVICWDTPQLLVTRYEILVLPAAIPDNCPLLFIIAIPGLEETQTPPCVELVNAPVEPTQIVERFDGMVVMGDNTGGINTVIILFT